MTLHRPLLAAALAFGLAAGLAPAHAQDQAAPAAASTAADMTDAEVRKVDREAGKITLRHAAIKALDMPPMTMVFQADPKLLEGVKPGDKVRFSAVDQGGGQLAVTAIQPAAR